jgi:Agrobacterium tumefaciens protein Atu4866
MRTYRGPRIDATILGAATVLALALGSSGGEAEATQRFETVPAPAVATSQQGAEAYVGVWMSADDTVRLDISADGTYARTVTGRKQAARGLYQLDGTTLRLRDESGVRTTVTTVPGGLEMAGYVLAKI